MHLIQVGLNIVHKPGRFFVVCCLLLAVALAIGACQTGGQEQPAATEAAAEQPAEEPAATEEPAEEPAATEEPAEEPAATEEPAEEPAATEAAAEEPAATEEPAEEPAATEESAEEAAMAGDPANGEYIATLTGGCGCHFNPDLGGLAGGRTFEGPFGVVYPANLTPDEATGIARYNDEQLIGALRTGQVEVDGEVTVLHPIMPYRTFSILSDKDAQDIVAYLRTLEPVENAVPARELNEEPQAFTPAAAPPAEAPTEPVARGEYLVTLAMCGGCHTPRNEDGSFAEDMMLAGATLPEDEISANITPDEATGIGVWSEEEIAHFMLTGMKPNGDEAEGSMAQQIERRFSKLTEEDAMAIAAYLKSIPAVSNDPFAN